MKYRNLKSVLQSNLNQIPGWKTDRKIIVFESDDWGSVRMPSYNTFNKLLKRGLKITDYYNRYDGLATVNDLEALFKVLSSHKDCNGRNPVITANCLVANPDFHQIKMDNFQKYKFEIFTETLKNKKGCENSFNLWKEGLKSGIFIPQFHGREHLNVALWMKALTENHEGTRLAFDYGFWGQETDYQSAKRKHFLAAFDYSVESQIEEIKGIINEGIIIFKNIFGYSPKSFIAPNFIWNSEIESLFKNNGFNFIQTQRKQLIPMNGEKKYKKKPHFTGQKNMYGQIYSVRNACFEPSSNKSLDWVSFCLRDISRAFFWKKPAIISAHRVNFIGSIVYENRKRNLLLLTQLLKEITKRWPAVEFMSTTELGRVMYNN